MTSITIKFTYCGEIRKKSFAQIPSFALIEREFQTYYGDRLPLHKKIEYQDQEGDIITIANEEDLQEALTGLTTVDSVPVLKLNITPLDQNTDMVQLENQTNIIVQNAGDAMMTDADEPVTLFWQIPKEGGFVYKRRIQPPPKLTCSAEVMNSISGVESVVVDIFMKIQDDWNNVTNSGILEERKQPSIDIKEKTFSFKDLHLQKLPSHFHQPKYSAFFLQFSINLHNGQTYNCKSAEFYIVSKPAQLHSGDVRFDISKVVPNSAPHNEKKQIVVLGDGFRPSPSWRVTFGDIEVQGTPWGQGALECFSPIVPSPITVPVNVRNKSGATQKNNLLFEFHGSVSMAEESLTLVTEPSFSDIGMQNDIFPLSSGLANNNYGWGDLHMLSGTSEFGQMLKLVNEEKQDVNQVDYELATPLWWSIYEQNYEMAEILLIKCGANPDLSDQNGVSPLHIAASSGALKMVTKLVEYGSNVNAETKYKETALHFAAGQGHPEIAQFLIQKGANFVSDNENESPLDWAKLEEQYNVIPLLTKLIKEKQKQKEMLEKQKLKSQQQKNGSKDYSIGTRSGTHTLNAKLVLLGESAVGKSSIVLRFVKGQFLEYQESTIGAAFLSQTVGLSDGNIIKYEIWDTAGQERYHSLAPMYYRGASCAIIVYDITCYESFQKAKSWVAELNRNGAVDIVIALLGNKLDLEHRRTVPNIEALNYCEENGLIFLETSAKTGSNINDVFVNIAQKLPARERIFGAKTEQRILSAQSNISHKEAGCCLII